MTAVQARVATPSPKVGSAETPRISERSSAATIPIGVPDPRWTTRSPSSALPGVKPLQPEQHREGEADQEHARRR